MKKIGIFDIQFSEQERKKFYSYCDQIFDEAYLTNHTFVEKFESEFSKFSKLPQSILVPSGTAALELALRTIGVNGKKVILPTNTFIATAIAIQNAGGEPLILDIEKDYFGLCPEQLKYEISSEDIGAVIVVHIGGHISPHIKEIVEICKNKNIPLIEDCAHAHGASLEGTPAGGFGIAGCFSHFLTKIMTTGEGGSLVTNDETFYQKAHSLRRFGYDPTNSLVHTTPGGNNFKVSEFQAALGLIELERITSRIEKRRMLANRYSENLKGSDWNVLSDPENGFGSYYKCTILPPENVNRKTIEEALDSADIPLTGGVYYYPLHEQPVLKELTKNRKFPVSDDFCSKHICPPCYPEISIEDVDEICKVLVSL